MANAIVNCYFLLNPNDLFCFDIGLYVIILCGSVGIWSYVFLPHFLEQTRQYSMSLSLLLFENVLPLIGSL